MLPVLASTAADPGHHALAIVKKLPQERPGCAQTRAMVFEEASISGNVFRDCCPSMSCRWLIEIPAHRAATLTVAAKGSRSTSTQSIYG